MRSLFEREMLEPARSQIRMCHFLETRLRSAVSALCSQSSVLQHLPETCRNNVRSWRKVTEEECVRIMAQHRPVLSQLRRVAGVLSSSSLLQNTAELIDRIEHSGTRLSFLSVPVIPATLFSISLEVSRLLRTSLAASIEQDLSMSKELSADIESVRIRLADLQREVASVLARHTDRMEANLSITVVIHSLGGIADLAEDLLPGLISYASDERPIRGKQFDSADDGFHSGSRQLSRF